MLVVYGSFEEQIEELATFIDSLSPDESKVQEHVRLSLEKDDQEAAIQAVVDSSAVLNNAAEKTFESSHNLLIHILMSAKDLSVYLPTILTNFRKLPAQSTGSHTSFNVMSTLFNVSPPQNRLPIFKALLEMAAEHHLYELIQGKFKDVPQSLKLWNASTEDVCSIYVLMADLSAEDSSSGLSTEYLIRAVETLQSANDTQSLTIRAVTAALNQKDRYIVDELLVLPPVKNLQKTDASLYELLSILSGGSFPDFKAFNDAHPEFYDATSIHRETIDHKIRVLTIAALSSRQDNRKLRYADVQGALEISPTEVEPWIIEAIKSGLVEGKLSQPSETFLVHRATYRTFEHEQWEEVSAKLSSWRESLQGILEVIDNVKNDINGGQQLANGYAGSDAGSEEAQSLPAADDDELETMDENAD